MKILALSVVFTFLFLVIGRWTGPALAWDTKEERTKNVRSGRHLQTATFVSTINRIEIINALTDTSVGILMNNTDIVLSDYNLTSQFQLNFRVIPSTVNTTNTTTQSYLFRFSRNDSAVNGTTVVYTWTDNLPPYAACGNTGLDYFQCYERLGLGLNRLVITPYSNNGATGTAGPPLIVSFTILSQHPACTIPKFTGPWESFVPIYPLPLSESQGGMLGTDLILFSGFSGDYSFVTDKVYAYDTSTTTETNRLWREMDPIPVAVGLTHTGHVVRNNTIYACGGYVGGNPYPSGKNCYIYKHTNPRGSQWSTLPALPEFRAGGGMIYDSKRNSLFFATGADRHISPDDRTLVDHDDVWELSLSNSSAGWIPRAKIPYIANHVGMVSITRLDGTERHYILGGQRGGNEPTGNIDSVYEYIATNNTWIARQSMLFPRGHFSSSVVPYKHCGFFIAGGAISTNATKTPDITYYSIDTNTWTTIGTLPLAINTPVCAISGEYYYCQTGFISSPFSWRRKIV